jgi:lactoylglutathione lyase
MNLHTFSISLAVKEIKASREFYEKFGFKVFGGDASRNWLILKNGDHTIGIFQGMFERNMLTFNPGGTVTPASSSASRTFAIFSAS